MARMGVARNGGRASKVLDLLCMGEHGTNLTLETSTCAARAGGIVRIGATRFRPVSRTLMTNVISASGTNHLQSLRVLVEAVGLEPSSEQRVSHDSVAIARKGLGAETLLKPSESELRDPLEKRVPNSRRADMLLAPVRVAWVRFAWFDFARLARAQPWAWVRSPLCPCPRTPRSQRPSTGPLIPTPPTVTSALTRTHRGPTKTPRAGASRRARTNRRSSPTIGLHRHRSRNMRNLWFEQARGHLHSSDR